MTRLTRITGALFLCLAALAPALPAAAQQQGGPYAPRMLINDRAVTNYELEQRKRFLQVLNSPGDLDKVALEALIDDKLRLDAAAAAGIVLTDEQIAAGMEEFAGRANLTTEQFVQAIGQDGVAAQSFRDFVRAGIAWREVVRTRFGPRAQISEAEIDRAMALTSRRGGARVLMSEIILRADTPAFQAESEALAQQLSRTITTPGGFAAAARRYSVSDSAGRGGRIDWIDLSTLPPQISAMVLSLGPGEVTEPIPVPNAIALFQLRAIEETDVREPETLAIEYAEYLLPGGTAEDAARVINRIDTCDDLYGIARGQSEERLVREVRQVADLPRDLALDLAKLDTNETTTLPRAGGVAVLMLCGRTAELGEELNRDDVRQRLFNQRMASYADGYLAELRADAIIREP